MSDIIDVIDRLRDMAGREADALRAEVVKAQAVLDRLDRFANEAQDVCELAAASDLFPMARANIPERSNLMRIPGTECAHMFGDTSRTHGEHTQCDHCGEWVKL